MSHTFALLAIAAAIMVAAQGQSVRSAAARTGLKADIRKAVKSAALWYAAYWVALVAFVVAALVTA